MTDVTARPAMAIRGEVVALQLLVGLFLALRLYFQLTADLFGDEAYYWMWGQKLGWSYFDHPPLHAWLLRLVSMVLGWSPFSVRALTWVSLAIVLAIFWDWSRRLSPADPVVWFWRAAAIYLASPLFFGMGTVAYNDHLVVALSLLAIHCFLIYAERQESAVPGALRWLYLAALVLGLAALSKYNAVFVGIGFAAMFFLRPRLRGQLATPHPWLAALLALATQLPVLYWNMVEAGASFRYHLDERWGESAFRLHWSHPLVFIGLTLLVWSPILIWPLIRLIRSRPINGFEDRARTLVLSIFAVSTLTMLAISVVLDAYFYWNIVALIGLMPLLVRHLGNPFIRTAHLLYGLVLAALIVANFSIIPINRLLGGQDNGSAINYGWSEIAGRLRAARAASPTDTIGGTRYSVTAQIGFGLGIVNAVRYLPDRSQYQYWQDELPLAGKSGIILVDEHDADSQVPLLAQHFDRLTEIDRFTITRFGQYIYAWRIYRGDGYKL